MPGQGSVRDSRILLDNVASGSGSEWNGQGLYANIAITADWSSGGSGGVIKVEESRSAGYSGTWSTLATITQAAASSQDTVKLSGVFNYIRTRLSTSVSGGTVTSQID